MYPIHLPQSSLRSNDLIHFLFCVLYSKCNIILTNIQEYQTPIITKARFGSYVQESVGSCGRKTVYKASHFHMLSFLSVDSPTGT